MTKNVPHKTTNRAALRGTAMHEVLENCIKKGKHPSIFLDHVFNIEGEDVQFDDDMVKWTTEALEWVQNYKKEHKGAHIISEAKLHSGKAISEDLEDEIWGTADVLIYSKDELVVFDYKGGYIDVEIEDNYQLIIYGIGGIAYIEDAMDVPPIEQIRLVIHQPRSGGAKELVVMRETLNEWGKYIEKAAKRAILPNAPLQADEKACKWCPVIGSCPAASEYAMDVAKNTSWPEVAVTISEVALVQILERAAFVRKFLDAAEQYALSRLQNGYSIPGFKVVGTRKHRRWKDEEQAEAFLVGTIGGPKAFKKSLITPAQAEKLLKDKERLAPLVETPVGDPCLAPSDDPRPALEFQELKVLDTDAKSVVRSSK